MGGPKSAKSLIVCGFRKGHTTFQLPTEQGISKGRTGNLSASSRTSPQSSGKRCRPLLMKRSQGNPCANAGA